MYTPPMFKPDRAASLDFAQARGFGTFCAWDGARPIASSLPFYLTYADDGTPHAAFHVARGNALAALADPTRRAVFERLRDSAASVGQIAAGLPVSRPAVSQHLKMLKSAGLVDVRADGTRRVYYIDPHGLGELRRYIDQFWDAALDAFKKEVEMPSKVTRRKQR